MAPATRVTPPIVVAKPAHWSVVVPGMSGDLPVSPNLLQNNDLRAVTLVRAAGGAHFGAFADVGLALVIHEDHKLIGVPAFGGNLVGEAFQFLAVVSSFFFAAGAGQVFDRSSVSGQGWRSAGPCRVGRAPCAAAESSRLLSSHSPPGLSADFDPDARGRLYPLRLCRVTLSICPRFLVSASPSGREIFPAAFIAVFSLALSAGVMRGGCVIGQIPAVRRCRPLQECASFPARSPDGRGGGSVPSPSGLQTRG